MGLRRGAIRALILLFCIATLLLCLGYFGHVHPVLDAIAIGRRVAIGVLVLCGVSFLFISGGRKWAVGFTASAAAAILLWHSVQPDNPGPLRIYSKNLFYEVAASDALIADIRAMQPDIVVLQELSENNLSILTSFAADYPHQALCPLQGWNGMAVLSRWPLSDEPPRCSDIRSLMAVRIERADAPFWVVNAHLQQPWPDFQWDHLNQALWVITDLDAPSVVAGDFNTVPWAAASATIGTITQTQPLGLQPKTYDLWGVRLPLDQIWAADGTVVRRPKFNSDHAGILGYVWLSPDELLENAR